MPRRLILFVIAGLLSAGRLCGAQAPADSNMQPVVPSTPATPPIAPQTVETPLPPAVVLPPPPVATPDADLPLSADEAARIALRRQPNIEIARQGIEAARGRIQQVQSALEPTVGLATGYNNVNVLVGTGGGGGSAGGSGGGSALSGTTGYTSSATLRQLVFDFNHTRDLVRQSAALQRVAVYNLTRVQQDTVLAVKQAYYTYRQALQVVKVNQDNLANRRSQLNFTRARLNVGTGLPADVVTAETAVSEAVLNLTTASASATAARVSLAAQMGIDPRTPVTLTGAGEALFASDDVNAMVTQALSNRPEIMQARETIRANGYALNAARTTNAPAVSASAGFTTRGPDSPFANDSLVLGAAVTFNIFDGGLTAGRTREARANLLIAQAQLNAAGITVTSDVGQAYSNMRTAEQRAATARIEETNAGEGVRIAEGRYRAGLGQFLDIITAQSQLLTAQTNRVNADTSVDQARAALRHAIAEPIPGIR